MGKFRKPSKKSRNTSRQRKKNRKMRLIKNLKSKEEEVADLQTQMIDFEKLVAASGERVFHEINKCSHENNNLVGWLKLYDEQIKNYQKEIYDLHLKLYFSQHPQTTTATASPAATASSATTSSATASSATASSATASSATASSATASSASSATASTQPQFKSLADYFDYMKNQE